MGKKTTLAIFLSLFILISYNIILSKISPKTPLEQSPIAPVVESRKLPETKALPKELSSEVIEEKIIGPYRISVSLTKGTIKAIALIDYQHSLLVEDFLDGEKPTQDVAYECVTRENQLIITGKKSGKTIIVKKFTFKSDYAVEFSISEAETGPEEKQYKFKIIQDTDRENARYQEVFYKQGFTLNRASFGALRQPRLISDCRFFGYRDRYFCVSLVPDNYSGKVTIAQNGKNSVEIVFSAVPVDKPLSFFMGPQKISLLKKYALEDIVNFGMFHPLARVLLFGLNVFYKTTYNWGLSILLVTIIINFLLFPLTKKSTESMKHMQGVQGEVEKIKCKYRDNPQKLNKEIFETYKKYKINPLSGCLPWLLQIPVFIGFFQVINRLFELKGARFLWIKDLSLPDHLFKLPAGLPFNLDYLNALPIVMTILMFFQQKITTQNTGGVQNEQQKILSFLLPIVMGVIFYNFSSALMIYWLTNSAMMFAYQYKMLKKQGV